MGKSASSTFRLYAPPAILSAYMAYTCPRRYFLRPRFGTRPPSDPSASNEWRKFARSRDDWRKPARLRGVFLSQTYAEPPLARKRMKSRRSSGTMWRKFTRSRDGWRKPARLRGVFLSQTYAKPPLVRKRMKSRRSSEVGAAEKKNRTATHSRQHVAYERARPCSMHSRARFLSFAISFA